MDVEMSWNSRERREAVFYDRLFARPATEEDVRRNGSFPSSRQFVRALRDCRGKTILDLGCGRGLLAVNLARSVRPRRLIGIDRSSEAVARAAALAQRCGVDAICAFTVGSAHELPIRDATVDIVVGVAILHHLEIEVAARELERVLRPGGQIHLVENNGDNPLLCGLRAGLNRYGWFRRESEAGHPLTRGEIDLFVRPFARSEVSVPYVSLFRTLAYGRRPLARLEGGLALLDRTLCNPLTRRFSMTRWIHVTKGE